MSNSPSFRQPVAVAATAIVVVTFFVLVFLFDVSGCFLYHRDRFFALFLVLVVLFSLGVVVLMFFPMLWLLSLNNQGIDRRAPAGLVVSRGGPLSHRSDRLGRLS